MVINVRREVAASVVGVDLIENQVLERVGYDRVLTGIALVGSGTPGDMEVNIEIGTQVVNVVTNSAVGLGILRQNVLSTRVRVPEGQKVAARVIRAPVTNPVRLYLHFLP